MLDTDEIPRQFFDFASRERMEAAIEKENVVVGKQILLY